MFGRSDILSDIKILDLSRIFTGPFCSQVLSDLGAEVLKIEPPGGDDTRNWGPPFIDEDISSYYFSLNRNKQCKMLDFNDDDDYAELLKFVQWADVVIENYRPGVATKLRVDFDTVKTVNPQLVYLSITGFGSTGPYRDKTAYDIIAQSESGLMALTGHGDKIAKVGVPIGDIAAGLYGALGILAALRKVHKTGEGIQVETNLLGSLTSFLTYQHLNSFFYNGTAEPMGTAHPNIVPYQSFRVMDGWISLAIGNDKLWDLFCSAMQLEILQDDTRFNDNKSRVENRGELLSILEPEFMNWKKEDLIEHLDRHGIPVGRVNSIQEVMVHPQISHLGLQHHLLFQDQLIPVMITPLSFTDTQFKEFFPPTTRKNLQ